MPSFNAGIAQLVERNLAKVEVASSSLVSRSTIILVEPTTIILLGLVASFLWRGSKAVMHRIANPSRSVRLRPAPPEPTSPATFISCRAFCLDVLLGYEGHSSLKNKTRHWRVLSTCRISHTAAEFVYFLRLSRISRSKTISSGVAGGSAGTSFFILLNCFTIMKITNAKMMKLITMVMKLP